MNITGRNICVIPARGGSKRIPRKNIKSFLGKPIIAYSIEAALQSQLFDVVMVSTDDEEIAKVAESYGAEVPFMRSEKNSNDFATTLDVLKEVITEYKINGKSFEYLCCIYPCAPFVTPEKLNAAMTLLHSHHFDSVFPVMKFGFPMQRSLTLQNEKISFVYPEHINTRSQDLENRYHDGGQFYAMNIEETILKDKIISDNSGAIIISEIEGQDIDNEIDWKLAELKYKINKS